MSLRSMARMRAAVDAPLDVAFAQAAPLDPADELDDLDELELDELELDDLDLDELEDLDEGLAGDKKRGSPRPRPRPAPREKPREPPGDFRAVPEPRGRPQSQALDILISLIPAEAIAAYIAAIGIAATTDSELARWICLAVVLVLTPGWVLVSYLESREESGVRLPLFEMVVGSLAFIAWSTAVPEGAWEDIGLPTWVGSLVVVLASAVLYLVTRIFAAWSR